MEKSLLPWEMAEAWKPETAVKQPADGMNRTDQDLQAGLDAWDFGAGNDKAKPKLSTSNYKSHGGAVGGATRKKSDPKQGFGMSF